MSNQYLLYREQHISVLRIDPKSLLIKLRLTPNFLQAACFDSREEAPKKALAAYYGLTL